jgi:hypothetical protein
MNSHTVRQLEWWLEWPAGLVRVGVVFLVGVAALAAVVGLPRDLRELGRDASRNSALSFSDREIAGGNGVVADQTAVYVARSRIPEDEPFHVAVGPGFVGGTELTVPYVESYFQYFLMPRRPAEGAPWIICYGCDLAEYASAEIVWDNGQGIAIARIQR